MDNREMLGLLAVCLFLFLFLMVWAPAEMLRKAGFPRWYAFLLQFSGFLGLIAFALVEWPVRRELAWLRLKAGEPVDVDLGSVEKYAFDLERRGEWKRAAAVFEELARKFPAAEGPDYYRNCLKRLQEKAGTTDLD